MIIERHLLFIALASILVSASVSGCNTIEGIGKDVERAGSKLEEAARKTKE